MKLSLSLETTFFGWGGCVAGENRNKAISSSKLRLNLKLKMSLAIMLSQPLDVVVVKVGAELGNLQCLAALPAVYFSTFP